MNNRILYLIQQAGSLMQMPRTHKRSLGTTFDTVASHSFHTAIMAYCIARMEKLSHEEASRAMSMGLLHDLAEARTGDLDFISKNYARVDEERAVEDQFKDIDFGKDLENVLAEYEKRETLVAKCAKDADSLQQMYQEWVLSWQGNNLAKQWFEGDFIHRVPHLLTESAKKLVMSMKDSDPNKWWWAEFVQKGVNYKHLNGSEKAK
jgi:putative hydrolases of HD superfamily